MISKSEKILSQEIQPLFSDHAGMCISVVMPLRFESVSPKKHLEKLVGEIEERLGSGRGNLTEKMLSQLRDVAEEVSMNRNDQGLGIYVSDTTRYWCTFPFDVQESITTGPLFQVRELLMKEQYAFPYLVLYLSEKEIRLYSGRFNQLKEYNNEEFPMFYKDDRLYEHPSRSTSYAGSAHLKSFEKEKSEMEKMRQLGFIQNAEDLLRTYVQHSEGMIICGNRRSTYAFLNHTAYGHKVIGVLNDTTPSGSMQNLREMAWSVIRAQVAEKMIDSITELREKTGEGITEKGLLPVWQSAMAGNCELLILEKNFRTKVYVQNNQLSTVSLSPPEGQYKEINDAVNPLLHQVVNKKGRVVFVEDGMLFSQQRIAAITRY